MPISVINNKNIIEDTFHKIRKHNWVIDNAAVHREKNDCLR